jgi:hypothetical protein
VRENRARDSCSSAGRSPTRPSKARVAHSGSRANSGRTALAGLFMNEQLSRATAHGSNPAAQPGKTRLRPSRDLEA